MNYLFMDFEASGLAPAWDVPMQAAYVETDSDLRPLRTTVLRARLPAYVVPAPDAMLVTGLDPDRIEAAPLSQLELMQAIAGILAAASPATILGYGNLKYDDELQRHSAFRTLHPPYATSMPGFARADVLIMLRAVAMLAPGAITIPVTPQGKPTMRLGPVCRANGIAFHEADAHDALNDVHATIALFRLLRERAPTIIAAMMANAQKSGPAGMLARPEALGLGLFNHMIPAGGIMPTPGNASSWAVADLTVDPTYLGATPEQLGEILFAKGERPIRLVKTNAQPILVPWEMAAPATQGEIPLYGELQARLTQIRGHASFRDNLAIALAGRFADKTPSPWPDDSLYSGGFINRDDAITSRRWHEVTWDQRVRLGRELLGDVRLRAFANRWAWLEAPEELSAAEREKGAAWFAHRLDTQDDVPWLTRGGALQRIAALMTEAGPSDPDRVRRLDAIERWIARRGRTSSRAA
jgi:exodeoxyribonuclease-1